MSQDITRLLEDWLHEPDTLPQPRIADVRRLVHGTPQQHGWLPRPQRGSLRPLFSTTRFAVAAVVVALFGGFLLVAQPLDRVAVTVPGAETEGLPPVTGPAGNGLIAFARLGDIYVGDPATGKSEAIVDDLRGVRPIFSPDGTHIAFGRNYGPGPHGPCDVVVVRADGSDERVITATDNGVLCSGTFVWAPDSHAVVVQEFLEQAVYPLLLLDASGVADPVPLPLDTPFGTDNTFLRPPDGDRLLVWDGTPALGVVDLDGSDFVDLGESSGLAAMGYEGFADAGWSPDGSRIAVLADAGNEVHLYVMGATGSFPRRLATIPWSERWSYSPSWSWSPDGSTIAVQVGAVVEYSPESCPGETGGDPCPETTWVTLINVETGEDRVLDATNSPGMGDGSIGAWWWSPDGRAIVLMRGYDSYGLRARPELVDIASDTATVLPSQITDFSSWQRVAAD
jgi:hypothetical protein